MRCYYKRAIGVLWCHYLTVVEGLRYLACRIITCRPLGSLVSLLESNEGILVGLHALPKCVKTEFLIERGCFSPLPPPKKRARHMRLSNGNMVGEKEEEEEEREEEKEDEGEEVEVLWSRTTNNRDVSTKYWATRLFARTTHLFAWFALLASLVHSFVLSFVHLLPIW